MEPRVHNIIGEESVLLCNSLYKRILQSYDAIVIVTFKVLSDHLTFLKDIDIFASCEFNGAVQYWAEIEALPDFDDLPAKPTKKNICRRKSTTKKKGTT